VMKSKENRPDWLDYWTEEDMAIIVEAINNLYPKWTEYYPHGTQKKERGHKAESGSETC